MQVALTSVLLFVLAVEMFSGVFSVLSEVHGVLRMFSATSLTKIQIGSYGWCDYTKLSLVCFYSGTIEQKNMIVLTFPVF